MNWLSGPRRIADRRRRSVLALAGIAALIAVAAASAATSRVTVAPTNNSLPTISGTPASGSTFTANPGTWTGSAPITFQYQWRICNQTGGACHDIAGATAQTYQLKTGDAGNTARVVVIGSNGDGFNTATSTPSAVIAAAQTAPKNTAPPVISGSTTTGSTLNASTGTWTGTAPITYDFQWLICDGNGNNCHDIAGAKAPTYKLKDTDAGNTVRVRVTAKSGGAAASSTSAPTAKIGTGNAPPAGSGCPTPAPGASSVSVNDVASPARLQVSNFNIVSGQLNSALTSFSVRFRVTDTCGHPVNGAAVYSTAVPYNMVSIPPETNTDGGGWVTLTFNRLSGYPATAQQRLMVMMVRARKPGGSVLAGISTRRLISFPVHLNG